MLKTWRISVKGWEHAIFKTAAVSVLGWKDKESICLGGHLNGLISSPLLFCLASLHGKPWIKVLSEFSEY